jgi:hypothetical protein
VTDGVGVLTASPVLCCGLVCVRCGCIIGKDYPYPIVDHTAISKVNMGRMKVRPGGTRQTLITRLSALQMVMWLAACCR